MGNTISVTNYALSRASVDSPIVYDYDLYVNSGGRPRVPYFAAHCQVEGGPGYKLCNVTGGGSGVDGVYSYIADRKEPDVIFVKVTEVNNKGRITNTYEGKNVTQPSNRLDPNGNYGWLVQMKKVAA